MQILRYGALITGAAYGWTHSSAIKSSDRATKEQQDHEHKLKQIEEAKQEYVKRTTPQPANQGMLPRGPGFYAVTAFPGTIARWFKLEIELTVQCSHIRSYGPQVRL